MKKIILFFTDVPEATAACHQRIGCDERGTGNGLQRLPLQPCAEALGVSRLPIDEASEQLGEGPCSALQVHLQLDQDRFTKVLLDIWILLPTG